MWAAVRSWWVLLVIVPWIINAIANPKPASIGFAAFMVLTGAFYVRERLRHRPSGTPDRNSSQPPSAASMASAASRMAVGMTCA